MATIITKLWDFGAQNDGTSPYGSLIYDGTFLYGMTITGGANNNGTIFKIKPDGSGYYKLWDFAGAQGDGESPIGSLYSDGSFLFGMTKFGGANNRGEIFEFQIRTNIDEINNYNKIMVYPNPAKDVIIIKNTHLNNLATISISNIQGELLMKYPINNEKMELNISNFSKGIYILKINDIDNIYVTKIIKE